MQEVQLCLKKKKASAHNKYYESTSIKYHQHGSTLTTAATQEHEYKRLCYETSQKLESDRERVFQNKVQAKLLQKTEYLMSDASKALHQIITIKASHHQS